MRPILLRIIGVALVVAGVAGLLFSIAGMVVALQVQQQLEVSLNSGLDVMNQTLVTTADGLAIANESLANTERAVNSLAGTIDGVAVSIDNAIPTVGSLGALMNRQLPDTITSAQDSLNAASNSARVIDGVLRALSAIPLFNLVYEPDAPLSQGLTDVADSLNGIPATLGTAGSGLEATADSLGTVQGGFKDVASNVGEIGRNLTQAKGVIEQYEDLVADLQVRVSGIRNTLGTWLTLLRLAVWALLIWLGIVQFALITQGLELIGRGRAASRELAQRDAVQQAAGAEAS